MPDRLLFDKPDEVDGYRELAGDRKAYRFFVGGKPKVPSIQNMMNVNRAKAVVTSCLSPLRATEHLHAGTR